MSQLLISQRALARRLSNVESERRYNPYNLEKTTYSASRDEYSLSTRTSLQEFNFQYENNRFPTHLRPPTPYHRNNTSTSKSYERDYEYKHSITDEERESKPTIYMKYKEELTPSTSHKFEHRLKKSPYTENQEPQPSTNYVRNDEETLPSTSSNLETTTFYDRYEDYSPLSFHFTSDEDEEEDKIFVISDDSENEEFINENGGCVENLEVLPANVNIEIGEESGTVDNSHVVVANNVDEGNEQGNDVLNERVTLVDRSDEGSGEMSDVAMIVGEPSNVVDEGNGPARSADVAANVVVTMTAGEPSNVGDEGDGSVRLGNENNDVNESDKGENIVEIICPLCDQYACIICKRNIWENTPAATTCGHLFCYSCIHKWIVIKKKKSCPFCIKKLTKTKFHKLYLNL